MKILGAALLASVALAATTAALGETAPATRLPPGPGLELIQERCVSCHTMSMITAQPKDAAGWAMTLQQMSSRGAEVSPEEMAVIIDYLVRALPAQAGAPRARTGNARQEGG